MDASRERVRRRREEGACGGGPLLTHLAAGCSVQDQDPASALYTGEIFAFALLGVLCGLLGAAFVHSTASLVGLIRQLRSSLARSRGKIAEGSAGSGGAPPVARSSSIGFVLPDSFVSYFTASPALTEPSTDGAANCSVANPVSPSYYSSTAYVARWSAPGRSAAPGGESKAGGGNSGGERGSVGSFLRQLQELSCRNLWRHSCTAQVTGRYAARQPWLHLLCWGAGQPWPPRWPAMASLLLLTRALGLVAGTICGGTLAIRVHARRCVHVGDAHVPLRLLWLIPRGSVTSHAHAHAHAHVTCTCTCTPPEEV